MFKGKKTATDSGDTEVMRVYVSPRFLWGFLIAWKQTDDHGDAFLKKQRNLLESYEKQAASATKSVLPNKAKSPPRVGATTVEETGEKGVEETGEKAGPPQDERLANAGAVVERVEGKGQGGQQGKKRTHREARW